MIAATVLVLAGCGGGGDGGGGGPANQAPTASFTVTPNVGQLPLLVTVNAAASSDPDGSIASYAWNFGDGGAGSGVSTTHTFQAANTFTITLTVTDNAGATATATRTVIVTVDPPPPTVTVSGRITFQRVPFEEIPGEGLDFDRTFEAPAREIEVELQAAAGGAALATTSTDQNGDYSFTIAPNSDVRVRAKALSRFGGAPGRPATWDLRVLNNTNSNALYVLDGTAFNTGVANVTRNLVATTGWTGFGGYSEPRAAAPFAILDTLYSAAQFVIANGSNTVQLPALSAFWSTQNRPSDRWNPAVGDIISTLYQAGPTGFPAGIYVLGAANIDTDEFDQHVVAHEFQHYLEDSVSRTDTVGGDHALSDKLDMRVSFSEGFSNAFSAMVLADPLYRDSFGDSQNEDFHFSLEDAFANRGWYSEASVQRIAWDLFDAANDPADDDTLTLGFAPMYAVFVNTLRDGTPLTSLFSFLTALKLQLPASAEAVEDRVTAETNIVAAPMDAYATTETNSGLAGPQSLLVLPIYSDISLNGPAVRLCTDTPAGTYNKVGNRRFLKFNVPTARTITVRVDCPATDAACMGTPTPDPDLVLSRGRSLWFGDSADPRVEILPADAAAGDYVLEVYEYSHIGAEITTPRGLTCLTVSITG